MAVARIALVAILIVAFLVPGCAGYAVLTHEAIIDAAWSDGIRPALLQRFPSATPEELQQAHAFGNRPWTRIYDLLHYGKHLGNDDLTAVALVRC